ncbi:MAG: hypothetical protein J0L62_06090 [Bacteroidetes bacterium]|nr:hypothetical protein [Bacteroidota bacterium]
MKKIIFFLLSISLFVSITSCSEKSDSEEKVPNADLFPVGNGFKWIYLYTDNTSGRTNTRTIELDKVGFFDVVKQEVYNVDFFRYPIVKKSAEVFYSSTGYIGYVRSDSGTYSVYDVILPKHRSETIPLKPITPGDTLLYGNFYRNNPIPETREYTYKDSENREFAVLQTKSVVASLIVNKVTYTNVFLDYYKITGPDSYSDEGFTYYVKGIGIVKRHSEGFLP